MMPSPFQDALDLLEVKKADLPVAGVDSYLASLKKALDSKEDTKAAVLIAVDASKSLITIAVAFFAAVGAFALNYRLNNPLAPSAPIILLGASATLTVFSMVAGFNAIGRAYHRAESPPNPQDLPWATGPLSGWLATQSMAGLVALVCFGIAVVLWEPSLPKPPDAQLTRIQQSLDDLGKRVEQQAGDLARLGQDMTAIRPSATSVAQALAAMPALDRQLSEIGRAVTDIHAKLAQPPPSQPQQQSAPPLLPPAGTRTNLRPSRQP